MSEQIKEHPEKPAFLKRRDAVLLLFLLAAAGILALALNLSGASSGSASYVTITIGGELYGTYSLLENQEIEIETDSGRNLLVIENGTACMKEADCPDGYCMDQGAISRNGQSIVCLPHRLVVTAGSAQDSDLDAVAQ